jgi:hypothetical protein
VVKLQQSEWVFFMGSLMAVIHMKALAIFEDSITALWKVSFFC